MTSSPPSSTSRPAAIRSGCSVATRPALSRATASGRTRTISPTSRTSVPRTETDHRRAAHPVALRSTSSTTRLGRPMTTMTAPTTPRPRRTRRGVRATGILAAAVAIAVGSYATPRVRPPSPAAPRAVAGAQADSTTGDLAPAAPGSAAGAFAASGSIAQIDHSIAAWTKNVAANPHDYVSATNLALLYHARGRLSADLGDQEKALAATRTALAIEPTDSAARGLQATIMYTLHDFSGAFAAADALYRGDHTQLGALATRYDAELELGRIAEARADLATLTAATGGPAIDVRAARLAYLTGDADGALRLARRALAAVSAGDENSDVGFYAYAVGEYSRLTGDAAAARAAYARALAVRDTDLGAIVGLARIDAFEGHQAAAIAGLRRAAEIAPQPETLALLGDLLAASRDADGAAKQFATVRFVEQLGEIQSTVFDRVLLRFDVDHAGASDAVLAKARASVADRPDTTGHDAVAWTLYRLGRFDDAAAEIALAAANGAADARLMFHTGAIDLARGDVAAGRAALERALALGPALDPNERAEAARLVAR